MVPVPHAAQRRPKSHTGEQSTPPPGGLQKSPEGKQKLPPSSPVAAAFANTNLI